MVDFRQRLAAGLEKLEIGISSDALDRLNLYFLELTKWSRKVNLIAKSATNEQIIENHFLDSLTIAPILKEKGTHLLDIGTGAGFPALVCKAAFPELAVTLVEPRSKRVSFLGHIARSLGLKGVKLQCCRVEDQDQLPSDMGYTHITARAVTDIGSFVKMVERFAPGCPQLICMKGPRWKNELKEASQILERSLYKLDRIIECSLPFSGAERAILLFHVNEHNKLM